MKQDKFFTPDVSTQTKPLNEVQRRLKAILDWWGANGENHRTFCVGLGSTVGCVVDAIHRTGSGECDERPRINHLLNCVAMDLGFHGMIPCSDSGFENARKMVLRAIELAA